MHVRPDSPAVGPVAGLRWEPFKTLRHDCPRSLRQHGMLVPGDLEQRVQRAFANQSVLMVGDSTMKQKAQKLASLLSGRPVNDDSIFTGCGGRPGVCHVHYSSMSAVQWCKAMLAPQPTASYPEALNRSEQVSVVVWNLNGLHQLHLGAVRRPGFSGVGSNDSAWPLYFDLLRRCQESVTTWYTHAVQVYTLTNHACSQRWYGRYAEESERMKEGSPLSPAYWMQLNEIGTASIRFAEIQAVPPRHVLDSFTDGMCNCTHDGRHYHTDVDGWWMVQLMAKLEA